MIQALRAARLDVGAAWFGTADLIALDAIARTADVIMICRSRYTGELAQLIAQARARGVRVLFDVDDLVFDDRFAHLVVETLDLPQTEETWNIWFSNISRVGTTMRLCDGVVVTNHQLAEHVYAYAQLPTAVIPNFLNQRQIDVSDHILASKIRSNFARDETIYLGYFSGSPSHNRDFDLVKDAVIDLLQRDRRIHLRVVGYLDLGADLTDGYQSRIDRHDLYDFVNLQRAIGDVEFNLVPLQDNVFTRCKSELKVFEAAIAGTVSIVSPRPNLVDSVQQGRTGYVASSFEWEHVLREATTSFETYREMAEAAAHYCLERYSPDRYGDRIASVIFGSSAEFEARPGPATSSSVQARRSAA